MLIVGDLHFDAPLKYEAGGRNLYLDAVTESLNNILQYTAKKGELILFLGDYFEKKDKIENRVKNRLIEALDNGLKKKLLQYVFIAGNHDINNTGEMTIKWLAQYGELITEPAAVTLQDTNFFLIPWGHWDVPSDLKGKYIIAGHMPLKGFQYGNGIIDNRDDCYDVNEILSKFEDGELVVGHYHTMQKHGRAMSIGSIVSVDFGDLATDKAVMRVSLADGKKAIIKIENAIKREIVSVSSNDDIALLKQRDFSDRFVRIDVVMNKVNMEKINMEILQNINAKWVDINLVRGNEKLDLNINEDNADIEGIAEFINNILSKQQNKEIYEQVIREVQE